jgi:hypothetical protein
MTYFFKETKTNIVHPAGDKVPLNDVNLIYNFGIIKWNKESIANLISLQIV